MKYRSAATQIKEIPVVFRGEINGASIIPADVNETISTWYYDGSNRNFMNAAEQVKPDYLFTDDIYVEYDGTLFGPLSVHTGMNGRKEYGATSYSLGGMPRVNFADAPFCIAEYSTPGYTYFMIEHEQQSGGSTVTETHTFKIWPFKPYLEPVKKVFFAELTGNGQIKRFHCRFALGENGTLHIKPYVILNGNIRVDLCAFASNGDDYISGDNEEIAFDCYVPVETHAVAYVEAENVGEYESILDAAMVVQYEDYIEPESIIGYEGINLNRR